MSGTVRRPLTLALVAYAFLVGACTPATQAPPSPTPSVGVSIVGTWNCGPPENPERDVVEVREDGTLTVNEELSLTWSVEGDRGTFGFPEGGTFTVPEGDDPFTIEEDRLVFDSGWVCTPAE